MAVTEGCNKVTLHLTPDQLNEVHLGLLSRIVSLEKDIEWAERVMGSETNPDRLVQWGQILIRSRDALRDCNYTLAIVREA